MKFQIFLRLLEMKENPHSVGFLVHLQLKMFHGTVEFPDKAKQKFNSNKILRGTMSESNF